MRNFSQPRVVATLAAGAAVAALFILGQPARAQSGTTENVVSYKPLPKGAVRLGGYFPLNNRIKTTVGNTAFAGGVDWIISRQGPSTNNYVSIDYIDRSSGSNQLRVIPVTYGSLHYQNVTAATTPYVGYGIGAYFTNQDIPDSVGFRETNHTILFGGYVNAGMEFNGSLFVDARLHLTTSVGSANPGGLEVTVGSRF